MAHSQGAIITEHALEILSKKEREQLIIFTFGGGSFIAAGKSHPDSHNYASAADFRLSFGISECSIPCITTILRR